MKLLNKLERKFGKIYISNLMLYVVIGNVILFIFEYLFPELYLSSWLEFDRSAIMAGQVWRIISFIFVPFSDSPIFMLFAAYFYWLIGTSLEQRWGGFRFNVFYFTGVVGTIIAGLISGYSSNLYLNLSLFLAYALVFPDEQFLLFFIIPIKAKYLAIVDAVGVGITFFFVGFSGKLAIIASFINIALFFGGDFWIKFRDWFKYRKSRKNFKIQMKSHKDE